MSLSGQERRGKSVPLSTRTVMVALVALVAAGLAATSAGEPTGTAIWDEVLKATLAAGVVVAAAKSPRWPLLVMATIAAGASGLSWWALAAWVGLALAIVSTSVQRRDRLISAVSAALAIQSLLRLPSIGFFGLPTILTAIAVAPVLFLGYRYGTRNARRITRALSAVAGCALLAIGVLGGLALVSARADVNSGVAAARRGLEAARAGDTIQMTNELGRAEVAFDDASDDASGVFARSLQLIPVAAQHHRAVDTAVNQGSVVVGQAAETVREADIQDLRLTSGSLDLQRLALMAPPLRSTLETLNVASTRIAQDRSPWLVAPVRKRVDELLAEVERLRPELEIAATAAEVVPDMLGASQPKTYFVIFATPAESRELGGFLGSWALVSFTNGTLELGRSGRVAQLYRIAAASELEPGLVSEWYMDMARPQKFPQNLPSSADMSQVAAVSRQVLAGVADVPIDGFIYVDGFALIDLLEISGPVSIPFQAAPLNADNAFQFFFEDQYRLEEVGRTEIFDQLAAVAEAVIERISAQTLPGPEELGRVLGPAARAGHLQIVTFDDNENDFLRSVKLLRDFGRDGTTDFVGLVQTNGLSNKIDLYLERALDYRVRIDQDGAIAATATATLRSIVPPDAPEFTLGRDDTRGVNRVLLSLYTPHELTGATLNGEPVVFHTTVEFELGRYLVEIDVPPTGAPFVVEFALAGFLPPGDEYSLEVWHQPLVNTDDVTVSVAQGENTTIEWSGPLVENLILDNGGASQE